MQLPVQRQRGVEVAAGGGAVELGAGPGKRVRVAGHPALGAGHGEFQQDVVRADQQVQFGGEFGDPVGAADVPGELLDGVDVPLSVQSGEQFRYQVDLGVDGVVVGDDRESGRGDLGVVG